MNVVQLMMFPLMLAMLCFTSCVQRRSLPYEGAADTSVIDGGGTAHVTRIIPVPSTVSPQAQKMLAKSYPDTTVEESLAEERSNALARQKQQSAELRARYPVDIQDSVLGGVPVRVVTPPAIPSENQHRILIELHGGGFESDSGSLTEPIPLANLTKTKVIAVLYRLAPEHPFPAAVDDVVAVYKELLKTLAPGLIGIYGTSAGATLTGEVVIRLRQQGLPLPGALGIFSGIGDWSQPGDSQYAFGLHGWAGHIYMPQPGEIQDPEYLASTNPRDPVLSPIFADLHGLPATLFVTSTRDFLLSGTTILHRAFLRANVDARLVVFEGLPHAFWSDPNLPESREAYDLMASFFDKQLRGAHARKTAVDRKTGRTRSEAARKFFAKTKGDRFISGRCGWLMGHNTGSNVPTVSAHPAHSPDHTCYEAQQIYN